MRRREFIMQVTVAAKRKRARIVSIQRWTIVVRTRNTKSLVQRSFAPDIKPAGGHSKKVV